MDGTVGETGPPSNLMEDPQISSSNAKTQDEVGSRYQEHTESMTGSSQSGNGSTKNNSHIPRCRWSNLHGDLLKQTYRQFGNDRDFIATLFPGFSKRLVHRKIGEIKAEIEEQEWLPKHDEVLIKAILKGASNWNKIAKRYLPRKSMDQVLARVEQLKMRLKNRKTKLDLSGQSYGKNHDEDDSFQSTKHTERTGGDDIVTILDDPLLPPLQAPVERFSIPLPKIAILDENCQPGDLLHLEDDLFNLGANEDGRDLYFDWHDNTLAISNSQIINFLNDFDFHLDPS